MRIGRALNKRSSRACSRQQSPNAYPDLTTACPNLRELPCAALCCPVPQNRVSRQSKRAFPVRVGAFGERTRRHARAPRRASTARAPPRASIASKAPLRGSAVSWPCWLGGSRNTRDAHYLRRGGKRGGGQDGAGGGAGGGQGAGRAHLVLHLGLRRGRLPERVESEGEIARLGQDVLVEVGSIDLF